MNLTRSERLWLCVPPAVLYVLDVGITLAGQDAAYWLGTYEAAIEGNPLAYPLLALHPTAFITAAIVWLLVVGCVLQRVPARLAMALTFLVTLGHAVGVATWLFRDGAARWLVVVIVFVAAKLLIDFSWLRAGIAEPRTG